MRRNYLVVVAVALCALTVAAQPAPSRAAKTPVFVALVASNVAGAFEQLGKESESRQGGVTIRAQYLGGTQIGDMIDQKVAADIVLVSRKITDPRTALLNGPQAVLRNREIILVPRRVGVAYTRALRPLFADLEALRLAKADSAAFAVIRRRGDLDFAAASGADAGPGRRLDLTPSLTALRR